MDKVRVREVRMAEKFALPTVPLTWRFYFCHHQNFRIYGLDILVSKAEIFLQGKEKRRTQLNFKLPSPFRLFFSKKENSKVKKT
jgi:hypothetical protein